MENRYILDIGSIISEINIGTAARFGVLFHDNESDPEEPIMTEERTAGREPIGDYEVTYKELCNLLGDVRHKWSEEDTEQRLYNEYYQRDLLYIYDRITLDMDYLTGCSGNGSEWNEKLLELKYEIRNML